MVLALMTNWRALFSAFVWHVHLRAVYCSIGAGFGVPVLCLVCSLRSAGLEGGGIRVREGVWATSGWKGGKCVWLVSSWLNCVLEPKYRQQVAIAKECLATTELVIFSQLANFTAVSKSLQYKQLTRASLPRWPHHNKSQLEPDPGLVGLINRVPDGVVITFYWHASHLHQHNMALISCADPEIGAPTPSWAEPTVCDIPRASLSDVPTLIIRCSSSNVSSSQERFTLCKLEFGSFVVQFHGSSWPLAGIHLRVFTLLQP